MPHMLPMSASQVGNPMTFFVLVVADDRLYHGARTRLRKSIYPSYPDYRAVKRLALEEWHHTSSAPPPPSIRNDD
jgi:hypothetical protein